VGGRYHHRYGEIRTRRIGVENLLFGWPKVAEQIRKADKILFLTDFDGTLAPIVERPEIAVMPEETRCH
jgi:hypothetical protein